MILKVFKTIVLGLLILLMIVVQSCGEKTKDYNFTVKGKFENIDSPYFYITFDTADSLIVDTIFVNAKGDFNYKGNIDKLTIASLFFNEKSWSPSIFINENWTVNINGDINQPDLIMVKGGDVNDDLTSFKKNNESLFRSKADLLDAVANESTSPEIIQNHIAELKNVNFELTNKARSYIEENPDKIASVILIQDFYKNTASIDMLNKLLASLTGQAANYPLTAELKQYSERVKLSQVGSKAPYFNLKLNGKSKDLNSLKGKYVYLTFGLDRPELYADEISRLIKIYPKFKGKNVEIISVVLDVDHNTQIPDSVKWDVFYDYKGWASDIVQDYNITSVPYGILISPDGYIIERDLKSVALEEKMTEFQKK